MTSMKALLLFIVLGLIATLTACLDDSQAGSGLTEQQVQQMIADAVAPLQATIDAQDARITELESGLAAINVVTVSTGSAAGSGLQKTAPTGLTCPQSGYSPAGQTPAVASTFFCETDKGYTVGLPATVSAITVEPAPIQQQIAFDSPDCQGNAFYTGTFIRPVVFSYGRDAAGQTSEIGMVDPADGEQQFNLHSTWSESVGCHNFGPSAASGYPILDNDPTISGSENSYTGPIG